MNDQALQSEITTDPNAMGYAPLVTSGSDQGIADILNAKTIDGTAPVPYTIFQPAMMQMACWGKIRVTATKAGIPDALLGLCYVAIDLLTNYKGEKVDMQLPAFQAAMAGLAGAGLLTPDEQTAILALASVKVSRAEQLFGIGVTVTQSDISSALRGQA